MSDVFSEFVFLILSVFEVESLLLFVFAQCPAWARTAEKKISLPKKAVPKYLCPNIEVPFLGNREEIENPENG